MSSFVSTPLVHKLVELQGLSLYWDHSSDSVGNTTKHNYLLEPVSGKAFVKRNTSQQPLKSQVQPEPLILVQRAPVYLSFREPVCDQYVMS